MRRITLVTALLIAGAPAARTQDADQEIVSGFLGGSSPSPAVTVTEPAVGATQAPRRHARGGASRSRTATGRARQAAGKAFVGPLSLPVRFPLPVPLAVPAQPHPGTLASPAARWTHPLAIGAGLTPVLLSAIAAGILRRRRRTARVLPPPAAAPDASAAMDRVPAEDSVTRTLRPNRESELARRYGSGRGEIHLARALGKAPDVRIRRIRTLAAGTEHPVGDTDMARDLRMGTGEVRLAIRLQQLSAPDATGRREA